METSVRSIWDYLQKIGPAWKELSGQEARDAAAAIKAFREAPSDEMKARGKRVADAINNYGQGQFLDEMIAPGLRENNPRVALEEEKALVDLIAKARKGDRDAVFELEDRTRGTPIGAAITAANPETKAAEKFEAENRKRAAESAKKIAQRREDQVANEEADAKENSDNFKKYLDDKIARGAELTIGEAEEVSPEQLKKIRELRTKKVEAGIRNDAGIARLAENASDLNWRRMLLMNPDKMGKSMSGDAFEQSIKATTGISEEAKRLHAILEVDKEIARNTSKLRAAIRIPR
jgi:hypothetical protein